jgi:hypothetical protein
LKYLQVYYAILMANNRFCIDRQCPSLLSLGGDAAPGCIREWNSTEGQPIGRIALAKSAFTFAPVYLNADFTGGELVFPDVDLVIIPKPCLLVGLPSNH